MFKTCNSALKLRTRFSFFPEISLTYKEILSQESIACIKYDFIKSKKLFHTVSNNNASIFNAINSKKCSITNSKFTVCINNCNTAAVEDVGDKFGTLSGYEMNELEMDEDELKEEEYYKNKRPKMKKHIAIRKCIDEVTGAMTKKNIKAAIESLKSYGSQANVYIYNIVLRELSKHGEMKECFSLYKHMKKIGLKPNAATYTTLINSCAESHLPNAIEQLEYLRQTVHEKPITLNEVHYNAMIKAYGRHGRTKEAFKLVDEMCDKRMPVGDYTYSALLQAAISNKEYGLRLALSTWHLMRYSKIQPKKHHYDLLLTAMRRTKLGELKVEDSFIEGRDSTKIQYSENEEPNLLQSPPVMSGLLLPLIDAPNRQKIQNIHTEIENVNTDVSNRMIKLYQNVNSVLQVNNLILFGGYEGILKFMELDNVKPDVITLTIILDMLPPSLEIEKSFLKYIEEKNILVDSYFYNILMKKRIFRKDFKQARDVLNIMQRQQLLPNLTTYQVLALSCQRTRDGMELLEAISSMGYAPNKSVIGVLFKNACLSFDFRYVSYLLQFLKQHGILPSESIITHLKDFVKRLQHAHDNRLNKIGNRTIDRKEIPKMVNEIEQFLTKMINLQEKRTEKSQKS